MKKWIGLLSIIFIICFSNSAIAQEKVEKPGQLTIIVIDKLSLDDLDPNISPTLCALIEKGSLGLCSNRTLGKGSTEDGYLTIGAGNFATASKISAFNKDEPVGQGIQTGAQYYQNLTGIPAGKNEVFLVNLPEIMDGMLEEKVSTQPGMLGEVLRKNRIQITVLGNADINDYNYRPAVAIAMDAHGRVARGNVGPLTSQAVSDSYLTTRSNYAYLQQQLESFKNQPGVKIIDLADLARMEKADLASQDMQIKERQRIVKDIDTFVENVAKKMDFKQDMLLVVVPSVSANQMKDKNTFTPLIIIGPDYQSGALGSTTTRRDYIVANTDIAPTILNYFHLPTPQEVMIGQPMQSFSEGKVDRLQTAQEMANQTAMVNRVRVPLVKGYVFLEIIIICLTLFCILLKSKLKALASNLLVAMGVIPFVFLIAGKIPATNDWQYILYTILLSIIITMAVIKICKGNYFQGLIAITALTLLVLNIDVLLGSSLIQSSVLGYDAMSGARYYGIGNEFVGVLMGASILLGAALYQRFPRPWLLGIIGVFFAGQSYLLAAPALGAQSDGMITAPAAFLVTLILLSGYRISPKIVLSIAGAVLASVFAFTVYDMTRPLELQSHIGRAANQIYQGGWQEAVQIIARKAGMNVKLIRYTIWTRVFISILLTLAVLVYRPVGAMKMIRDKYPLLFKGFAGILLAAIIGGVINDSGIVSAATTCIYLITPLLLLVLKNLHEVKDLQSEDQN